MRANEIAIHRFGFGARNNELQQASKDPIMWLESQLVPMEFKNPNISSDNLISLVYEFQKKKKAFRTESEQAIDKANAEKLMAMREPHQQLRKKINNLSNNASIQVLARAIKGPMPFQSKLLDFFSNHFSVSGGKLIMKALAPTLEREAIAPNLVGHFSDMLIAVEQHPAMLTYLNNRFSIGPDSTVGKRKTERGLNENLAREILELHTLGVNGGYKQDDVIELAKAITGWSVAGPKSKKSGFIFREKTHQPGSRTVLNKQYSQKGVKKGEAILRDLANHPKTALFVCSKLARHFIADTPPNTVVTAMVKTWNETNGLLKNVLSTMIQHPDAWLEQSSKFKSPREFVISACRVCTVKQIPELKLVQILTQLGQAPFNAGSPEGYPDEEMYWLAAEALINRIDWSEHLASDKNIPPSTIIKRNFIEGFSENSSLVVSRAESKKQGLALLLMSPEFQRR
jgi:uncharacterized protein (DUF1800 family)